MSAPPVRVPILSAGAAQGLVRALQQPVFDALGLAPQGAFGAVGAMRERLQAGDPCDVIVLTQALLDALAAEGTIDPTTCRTIGAVPTALAVCGERPAPRIDSAGALRSVLLGASAIHLPDPTRATAGIHFAGVLRRLGVADALADRLRPHPNGTTAMTAMVREGDAGAVGCTQASEILAVAGARLVGPLPAEFALSTVYAAAVTTRAADPVVAARLVAALTGDASRPWREAAGFA